MGRERDKACARRQPVQRRRVPLAEWKASPAGRRAKGEAFVGFAINCALNLAVQASSAAQKQEFGPS